MYNEEKIYSIKMLVFCANSELSTRSRCLAVIYIEASGTGVFWFTTTFSSGGIRCSRDSGSFRSQNLGV